ARGVESAEARKPGALGVASVLTLLGLLLYVPWRAADKYYHYRGMRPDIREMARSGDFGTSVVFIRGNRHPDYHAAAGENPLDLTELIIATLWFIVATAMSELPDRTWPGQQVVRAGTALEYGTATGDLVETVKGAPTTVYGITKREGTLTLEKCT